MGPRRAHRRNPISPVHSSILDGLLHLQVLARSQRLEPLSKIQPIDGCNTAPKNGSDRFVALGQ
jgi:hypothetical protein